MDPPTSFTYDKVSASISQPIYPSKSPKLLSRNYSGSAQPPQTYSRPFSGIGHLLGIRSTPQTRLAMPSCSRNARACGDRVAGMLATRSARQVISARPARAIVACPGMSMTSLPYTHPLWNPLPLRQLAPPDTAKSATIATVQELWPRWLEALPPIRAIALTPLFPLVTSASL